MISFRQVPVKITEKEKKILFLAMSQSIKDFFFFIDMLLVVFSLKGAEVIPVEKVCVCPQATGEVFRPGSCILRRWDHRLWCWTLHVYCITGPNLKPCVLLKFFVPLFSILSLNTLPLSWNYSHTGGIVSNMHSSWTNKAVLAEQLTHSIWGF